MKIEGKNVSSLAPGLLEVIRSIDPCIETIEYGACTFTNGKVKSPFHEWHSCISSTNTSMTNIGPWPHPQYNRYISKPDHYNFSFPDRVVSGFVVDIEGSRVRIIVDHDFSSYYVAEFHHADKVNTAQLVTKTVVITSSDDGTAKVWNWYLGKCLLTLSHEQPVIEAKFFWNRIVTITQDFACIRIWSVDGICLHTIDTQQAHADKVTNFFLDPDHETLETQSAKNFKSWDVRGSCKTFLTLFHESTVIKEGLLWNRIVTITQDSVVRIWDFDGTCLKTIRTAQVHNDKINSLVIDQDNEIFVTCSSDQTAKIWDLEGNCLATLPHTGEVSFAVLMEGINGLCDTLVTVNPTDVLRTCVLRKWDLRLMLFPSQITSSEILFLNRVYQATCSGTKLEREDEKRLQAMLFDLSIEKGSALLQKLAPYLTKSNQSKL